MGSPRCSSANCEDRSTAPRASGIGPSPPPGNGWLRSLFFCEVTLTRAWDRIIHSGQQFAALCVDLPKAVGSLATSR